MRVTTDVALDLFDHMEWAFLDAWTNQPFAFRNTYHDTTIANERESVRSYYPRGRAFIEGLTAERPQPAWPVAVRA